MAIREITDSDMSAASHEWGLPLETIRGMSNEIALKREKYGYKDLVAALRNWCKKEVAAIARKSTWTAPMPKDDSSPTDKAPDPSTAFYRSLPCLSFDCRNGRLCGACARGVET